ncbi:hypothetical protein COU20_01225 [Candidatus Kaiserbacteria bacterium CG10_big_fil_rev_8_21_14_0_10_59_10]|uniref:Histidyl-tRNA synthetase n=1 Tax=Candidatus Kaiserbacteria bacterium CG10_big_fil_rev_8_21_14_0_10_59_10 TaxID=1974612 RepID=A0A2H0UAC1_9BACT|nr:MAG: hypothetical protein COU20_01225 [Candidatus Kaiserbacteria bacterium CG10_big_fil_rev_8_21_14_0_10_59_10]
MLRLKDTLHQNTAGFLEQAVRTAEYYGFQPVDSLPRTPRRRHDAQKPKVPTRLQDLLLARKDERTLFSSAKLCLSCTRQPERPLLLWRVTEAVSRNTNTPCAALEFHVIGTPHAVAEALLIVVTNAIAEDAGIGKRTVSINSIGSLDSSNRFLRDVSGFLRKHIETISPTLRPRAATDPLGTLIQLFERGHPAVPRAPAATEYLTEEERRRFWELLEYLEVFGVPYELDPAILGSHNFWSHTLFEVSAFDEETGSRIPFASGGRYDPLATRLAGALTPAVVVTIMCESRGRSTLKREAKRMPALYFAHLGPEARRRLLPTLELLRHSNIPVHQSLMFERLGEQMEHARETGATHLLIMGHKEAVEGTVLVREVATNSQEAILIQELPSYLRRYRIATRA